MRTCESLLWIMTRMKSWRKCGNHLVSPSNFAPITLRSLNSWRSLPIITSRKVPRVRKQWSCTRNLLAKNYTSPFIKRTQKVYPCQATKSYQSWASPSQRIWLSYLINHLVLLLRRRSRLIFPVTIFPRNKAPARASTRRLCQNLMIIQSR